MAVMTMTMTMTNELVVLMRTAAVCGLGGPLRVPTLYYRVVRSTRTHLKRVHRTEWPPVGHLFPQQRDRSLFTTISSLFTC